MYLLIGSWMVVWFAILLIGAVPVLLNTTL